MGVPNIVATKYESNKNIYGESTTVLDNIPDYYVPSKITHFLHPLACFIFGIIWYN